MRKVGLLTAAILMCSLSACGSSDDTDNGSENRSVAYGARSCSDWAGRMDDEERWDAAEELLLKAKGSDGTEGDLAPSTREHHVRLRIP